MSFKASMAGFLARLCKADRNMAENLQNPPRNTGALDIVRFTKKVRVKNWDIRGFKGVTINGSYPGRGHILMLPGGAYSLEPGKHHRRIGFSCLGTLPEVDWPWRFYRNCAIGAAAPCR